MSVVCMHSVGSVSAAFRIQHMCACLCVFRIYGVRVRVLVWMRKKTTHTHTRGFDVRAYVSCPDMGSTSPSTKGGCGSSNNTHTHTHAQQQHSAPSGSDAFSRRPAFSYQSNSGRHGSRSRPPRVRGFEGLFFPCGVRHSDAR